ncbi:hypothetical protein HNR64_002872 [Spongiibacter marinus]|nr:hypothetical protein [Spongiibacter marinus]
MNKVPGITLLSAFPMQSSNIDRADSAGHRQFNYYSIVLFMVIFLLYVLSMDT